MEGTAAPWVAGSEHAAAASNLYVVAFARSCGAGSPATHAELLGAVLCVEVPAEGFPSVGVGEEIQMWERPYSTAATTVGPWWRTMVLPTLVEVRATDAPPFQPPIQESM